MFNILAQIRIALRPGSELGEIAISLIQDEFIPKVDQMIEKGHGDLEKLQEIRKLWVDFSDKTKPDTMTWQNIAGKQLQTAAMKFPAFKGEIQEVESRMVEGFLSDGRYRRAIDRFDVLGGPNAFGGYFSMIIRAEALNAFRNIFRDSPEHGIGTRSEGLPEEGDDSPRTVLDDLASPAVNTNLDLQQMKKQLGRLDAAFERKYGHNKAMMAVYHRWMSLAEEKGAENINFKRDVEAPLLEVFSRDGIKGNRTYISQLKQEMLRFFTQFFKQEEGEEEESMVARFKKGSLKIAENLAGEHYSRRLASWVLELHRFATS